MFPPSRGAISRPRSLRASPNRELTSRSSARAPYLSARCAKNFSFTRTLPSATRQEFLQPQLLEPRRSRNALFIPAEHLIINFLGGGKFLRIHPHPFQGTVSRRGSGPLRQSIVADGKSLPEVEDPRQGQTSFHGFH